MSSIDFQSPLSRYFLEDVAQELDNQGIPNLDALMDLIYAQDTAWWTSIHLEKKRANGILKWLYDHRFDDIELPERLAKQAVNLTKAYYAEEVEPVSSATFDDMVNFEQRHSLAPRMAGFSSNANVVPLESIKVPALFDGSQGSNRAPKEQCSLSADQDLEAIRSWLKARAANPNTFVCYRKEAERFLLWSIVEQRCALSSLNLDQCASYLHWLEMLGRTDKTEWAEQWHEPQDTWIGPKNVARTSAEWRPFNTALSHTSRKTALTVIRQLFSFLQKTGYLKMNPFDQISTKVPFIAGEGRPKEFADRSLSEDQWAEILQYLETKPEDLHKARLKVILLLGKSLGMRASEILAAEGSWIESRKIDLKDVMMISIVGKGDKERRLPISPEQVKIINDYMRMRNDPPIGTVECADKPLLISMRRRKDIDDGGRLSRSGLYLILSDFLEEVAAFIEHDRPMDAAKLRKSSTHWLRHTFAVSSLKVMPVNVVQTALGHASVGTTSRYITPEEKEIVEGMKKNPAL